MSNARRILLVDGDPVARKNIEQVLSGKGCAVTAVPTCEDALWELDNGSYDAVFTETVTRGMSGLVMAEEIHIRKAALPVVFITSHGAGIAKERIAAAGITEILHKPVSPEQLAETVERVLPGMKLQAPTLANAGEAASVPTSAAVGSRLKSIVLFLLAPFVGLVYLLTFPVFALGMVLWRVLRKPEDVEVLEPVAMAKPGILKTGAMMIASIVIGVVYAVASPIIGIGFLVWFGFQAWGKLGARAIGSRQI